jgi:cytochrome bd-type quinol oxidase subunit 1
MDYGFDVGRTPASLRVYDNIPLHLSTVDMGLALLIVVLKSLALWERDESYGKAARFWARIFAINFAMGVVTGIPMEFQFGSNWAAFSKSAGGIIGQTLAMEGSVTTI